MAVRSFAGLLVLALLAGCTSGTQTTEDQVPFDGLEGQASATTGVLRGVVVDDRIVPIVGAVVDLRGASEAPNQTTDDQGRFLFSDLPAGTYFLHVSSPLHKGIQSSADVVAGEAEPRAVRIQMERLFTQDPFVVQITREGYFQCSQAGAGLYASSNCVYDPYRWAFGPGDSPTQPVDNVTTQTREWHSDIGPGWQTLIFEMQWTPTSQGTSANMGIVVSTQKSTRDGAHHFAQFEGGTPIRGQIDVGVEHESAANVEPTMIPPEGMTNMSYFVGVREDGFTPGIAYQQQFELYLTMFYYGKPPEGWSFINNDPMPF